MLIGYQAEGIRSRDLQEGTASVKIFGETVPVHCQVQHLDGFSAHADRPELLRWLGQFRRPPKQTFVVHGEPAAALATTLRQRGWSNVRVPDYLDPVLLFENL